MYIYIYIAAVRHMVTTKPGRILPYLYFVSTCVGRKSNQKNPLKMENEKNTNPNQSENMPSWGNN